MGGWGGGGHCPFEERYPKQDNITPILCYHKHLSISLSVHSPLFLRLVIIVVTVVYPQQAPFVSYSDTINLITVIKRLIIANPWCFP